MNYYNYSTTNYTGWIIAGLVVTAVAHGVLCLSLANRKGYITYTYFWLGFFLWIPGLLYIIGLPMATGNSAAQNNDSNTEATLFDHPDDNVPAPTPSIEQSRLKKPSSAVVIAKQNAGANMYVIFQTMDDTQEKITAQLPYSESNLYSIGDHGTLSYDHRHNLTWVRDQVKQPEQIAPSNQTDQSKQDKDASSPPVRQDTSAPEQPWLDCPAAIMALQLEYSGGSQAKFQNRVHQLRQSGMPNDQLYDCCVDEQMKQWVSDAIDEA